MKIPIEITVDANLPKKSGGLYLKDRLCNGGTLIKQIDGEIKINTHKIETKLEARLNPN